MSAKPKILYCHCAYAQAVPKAVKDEVLERLSAAAVPFVAVADLCELSARKDPELRQLGEGETLRIAACYPRAVRWLFSAGGAPLADNAEILNMRVDTAEAVAEGLLCGQAAPAGEAA